MKKISTILLAFFLSFFVSGCNLNFSPTDPSKNEQGLDFYLLDDDTYGVGVGTATMLSNITIPEKYLGRFVTSIIPRAFSGCSSLKIITIPKSVTSIGDYAFFNCSSLTSIVIPNTVTRIDYKAFDNCSSLTIYCEASSNPTGWDSSWKDRYISVVWNYRG